MPSPGINVMMCSMNLPPQPFYHSDGVDIITNRQLLSAKVPTATNANQTFAALLRMAHDRRCLRPARPGKWSLLLRLFGIFPPANPEFGIEPSRYVPGLFSCSGTRRFRRPRG